MTPVDAQIRSAVDALDGFRNISISAQDEVWIMVENELFFCLRAFDPRVFETDIAFSE